MGRSCSVAAIAASVLLGGGAAHGQTARPPTAVEVNTGYAAFPDEAPIEHFVIGAAPRFYVSPRVGLGPEFTYMIGPGDDRDIFLTGNVWFDFRAPPPAGVNRVAPYLVAGGGVMFHRNFLHREGVARWFAKEPAFSGGFGVRLALNDRWYVAPEGRLGWEPHARLTATVGYRFNR